MTVKRLMTLGAALAAATLPPDMIRTMLPSLAPTRSRSPGRKRSLNPRSQEDLDAMARAEEKRERRGRAKDTKWRRS